MSLIQNPIKLRIGNCTVRVFGSQENEQFWSSTRPLKPFDCLSTSEFKQLSSNNIQPPNIKKHPKSQKPKKKSFLDKARIIWKLYARKRNSGNSKK